MKDDSKTIGLVLSVAERRELAMIFLDLATDADRGRSESDRLYKAITENRDTGKSYSSCGDLAHWLLYRVGVRGAWLNRQEHTGWAVGLNVARLAFRCPEARKPRHGEIFNPGDVLIVWNLKNGTDAHVLVVREHVHLVPEGESYLLSADGGQPGIKRRKRAISDDSQRLSSKTIQIVIPFSDVLLNSLSRSELQAAEMVSEWLSEIHASGPPQNQKPTLRAGDSGEFVKEMQRLVGAVDDGHFGPRTEARVLTFQSAHGLDPDGVVGDDTWKALRDQ